MIRRLAQQRMAKARDQRYGPDYNFGATYYDARDEAIRRGDRTIGTEHLVLALLVDPASPTAEALGCDLDSAHRALDALDSQALAAIGVPPGITAGPVAVRATGRLRLTPAAKAVITGIRDARKNRLAGPGIVLSALLDLPRPDPAAELLAALGVDARAARDRLASSVEEGQLSRTGGGAAGPRGWPSSGPVAGGSAARERPCRPAGRR
jgi:Clp amino terminal domain, pathogenicity island component